MSERKFDDYMLQTLLEETLNRLAKWRVVFTGWQLGSREKGDPEGDAVRDHRELSLLMRVEITALTGLLIEKGVFTREEYMKAMIKESDFYDKQLERKFPGFRASDTGMIMTEAAVETTKGWKP